MLQSSRTVRIMGTKNIRSLKKMLYRSFIGMSFLAIICCGKKVEDSSKSSDSQRYDVPISNDVEQALSVQQLSCEPGAVCPNYLGMINIVEKNKIRSCSGYLVARDILATTASCLPSLLRLAEQDCSKDVHVYFAGAGAEDKTLRVKCRSVIAASNIKGNNPILWRDDVAYLKLDSALPYRRTLQFSRKGLSEDQSYTSWFVSRMDEKTSFIKKSTCLNIQKSYVNPFASHISSPNILMSDCELSSESSGSPIIDRRGEVRGMISTVASTAISDYLLRAGLTTAPLKKIFHGSSFACAQTIYDSQVLDEAECFKNMSQIALDEEISKILNTGDFVKEALVTLQGELDGLSPYVNLKASLAGEGMVRKLSFSPVCFKTLKDWINTVDITATFTSHFSFPQTEVRRSLDRFGKLSMEIIKGEVESYNLQFSTKFLRRNGNSRIYFWNDHFNFSYPRVTANCQ